MSNNRLVIRPHRPWRRVCLALVAVALFSAGAYFAYTAGRDTSTPQRVRLEAERGRLDEANSRLEATNEVLRQRAAILERASQIERKAYADVDRSLKELQEEILDLKEEVAFYRGIVGSGQARGLAIQSFDVQRDGSGRDFSFRLVLTGDMKGDKVISGLISLSIAGERDGKLTQLSLAELSDQKTPGISFQLKYFQKIRGRLTLPADFVPHRVFVQVTASGETPAKVEKTFDWPAPAG